MRFKCTQKLSTSGVPEDHSRQCCLDSIVARLFAAENKFQNVLDLGCGAGESIDLFRTLDSSLRWFGVDLETSPEVDQRTRRGQEFHAFDGVNLPFADNYFDLIYCKQVFEHVRQPRQLLKEVHRVLQPGGLFIGSTSQLEPYHSYSVCNYTPYGFKLILDEAGLALQEVRPSIDAFTLYMRTALGRPRFFGRWWQYESPINRLIGVIGWLARRSTKEINFAKLIFCGQFCFIAKK